MLLSAWKHHLQRYLEKGEVIGQKLNLLFNVNKCMTIRDKIWYELLDVKKGEIYCSWYVKHNYRWRKSFKIINLTFSGSGILSWAIFKSTELTIVALIITSIVSVLQLLEGQIYHSDAELSALHDLVKCRTRFLSQLDRLWLDVCSDNYDEETIKKDYFDIKDKYDCESGDLDKKVRIRIFKSKELQSDNETINYFSRYIN